MIRLVDGSCGQRPSCIRQFLFSFLTLPRYRSALAAVPKKKNFPGVRTLYFPRRAFVYFFQFSEQTEVISSVIKSRSGRWLEVTVRSCSCTKRVCKLLNPDAYLSTAANCNTSHFPSPPRPQFTRVIFNVVNCKM